MFFSFFLRMWMCVRVACAECYVALTDEWWTFPVCKIKKKETKKGLIADLFSAISPFYLESV